MVSADDANPAVGSPHPECELTPHRAAFFARAAQSAPARRAVIRVAATAVAGTLAVVAAAIGAWWFYSGWRIGRIELFTDDGPIVAQVLGELSDEPIGEPFDLNTRAMLSLPAGEYRLRVTGLGRLSRTFRFAVNRGETIAHTISIDEGRLFGGERRPTKISGESRKVEAIPFATTVAALEICPARAI